MQEADPNAACTPLLELNYSKDIDLRQGTMVHGVFWSLKASWFSRRLMKAGTRNMLFAQISCLVLKH